MKTFALFLALTASWDATPPRKDDASRASKNGKLVADFGAAKVQVTYGAPLVKGRKIWGDLIPYGKVWRAGADEATVVAFSKDVTVEGKALPAGQYGFFAIPSAGDWTIIFNKVPNQWGAFKYDQSKDALRVTVKPHAAEMQEALKFEKDGDALVLRWGKLAVPVTIKG